MSAEKSIAIVLKVVDFSETSAVVTLMTREFGKVTALAKGARRPKGPFESALDVLSICRVVFLRKSGDALHLLTEAKLERRFRGAERDLESLYTAYYVVELLLKLTDELDPHTDLYDTAEETIIGLDSVGQPNQRLLRFQLMCLSLLGHLPSLVHCVECGKPVGNKRTPFGLNAGGVFCSVCRSGKRNIVSLSEKALEGLRILANKNEPWQRVFEMELPLGEMRGLVDQYIAHLLGNKPRLMRFLSGRR